MADLIARALGKAALRRVAPRETEAAFTRPKVPAVSLKPLYSPELLKETEDALARMKRELEQEARADEEQKAGWLYDELASTINLYCAHLAITGEALRDRLSELARSDEQLSRIRLKCGWHDASKVVPSHSRHVLVWTQRGEYRAWYDHVHGCWRVRRDGLKITHWREQCGPDNWPAAKQNTKEEKT